MKSEYKYKWEGVWLITIRNTKTNKLTRDIVYNTITNLAFDEIIKGLYGSSPDMEIKELAIGDGSSVPSATNTTLDNEVYRISDTTAPTRTGVGQVTTEFILLGTEYTGPIEEIGVFVGSGALPWGAGAGKDTGLLLSRILWSHTMVAEEEIYFQRVDNIS